MNIFILFEPDSDFVKVMLAMAPFAWGLMFAVRMFTQKKENKTGKINSEVKNLVIDPDEFQKKNLERKSK